LCSQVFGVPFCAATPPVNTPLLAMTTSWECRQECARLKVNHKAVGPHDFPLYFVLGFPVYIGVGHVVVARAFSNQGCAHDTTRLTLSLGLSCALVRVCSMALTTSMPSTTSSQGAQQGKTQTNLVRNQTTMKAQALFHQTALAHDRQPVLCFHSH
jgi:hypothetical protein